MPPSGARLGDGGEQEIGADGEHGRDADAGDQERSHQRPGADARQADEKAYGEAAEDDDGPGARVQKFHKAGLVNVFWAPLAGDHIRYLGSINRRKRHRDREAAEGLRKGLNDGP